MDTETNTEYRRSPVWGPTALYLGGVGSALLAGHIWWGLSWNVSDLGVLFIVGWVLWLSLDRVNLNEYAIQAADDADRASRNYDELATKIDGLIPAPRASTEQITIPIPPQPPTEPMARAWDTSVAKLVEDHATQREIGGRTFNFRAPHA